MAAANIQLQSVIEKVTGILQLLKEMIDFGSVVYVLKPNNFFISLHDLYPRHSASTWIRNIDTNEFIAMIMCF